MNDNLNRTMLSEYYGSDQYSTRVAKLFHRWSGYEVEFWDNEELVQFKSMFEKSKYYAEDACENWVTGIIK